MALSMFLRNTTKLNGVAAASCMKGVPVRLSSPLKTYTNLAAALQRNALAAQKPNSLVKTVAPLSSRAISLSAPKLSAAGGSHTALWTAERALSLAMLGVLPAAFLFPSQPLDALMAISVVLHTHWGLEAIVVDYARPAVVGNIVAKGAHVSLLLLSVATLGGLFYLIYNDIGIANSIKKLWAVKGQ